MAGASSQVQVERTHGPSEVLWPIDPMDANPKNCWPHTVFGSD